VRLPPYPEFQHWMARLPQFLAFLPGWCSVSRIRAPPVLDGLVMLGLHLSYCMLKPQRFHPGLNAETCHWPLNFTSSIQGQFPALSPGSPFFTPRKHSRHESDDCCFARPPMTRQVHRFPLLTTGATVQLFEAV
jgi:hypothetical protein